MSRHEAIIRLQHVLDHAREAVALISGRSYDDLAQDRMLELSLTRLVEIVGEAANYIPRDLQKSAPEIPWAQMVSMRNRLIHGYDRVDLRILWDTVETELPPLVVELDRVLQRFREAEA